MNVADLFMSLGADDSNLDKDLRASEGKAFGWLNGLTGKISGLLGGVVAGAVGGAVALVGTAISGEVIDQAFDNILIKTGATGQSLEKLQGNFRDVFQSIPTEAGPASDVLANLYNRANLSGTALTETSKKVLEASRLLKEDAGSNSELFTRVMGDWSVAGDMASVTMDKIFVASQKSGVGMGNLMSKVVQFGAPMRLMGFTLDDSISLFAKWEKEGVNAELVMGSLRIAAGKFADQGKPLRESLMATFDSIKNNKDETAALSQAMDVFGARAGPDMAAAIREGRFDIEDMLNAVGDAGGAITDTAKKTEDWGEKLTKLKNKAMIALEPIGGRVLDVASKLADKAGPALDWVVDKIDKYAIPVVDKLFDSLDKLTSGDVSGAIENLFGSEAANMAMTFFGQVQGFFGSLMPGIVLAKELGKAFLDIFGPGILESLGSIGESIGTFFGGLAERASPFVNEVLVKLGTWVVENGPLIDTFFATIAATVEGLVPILLGAIDIITPLLSGLVDIILLLGTYIMQVLTGDWAGAWATAGTILLTALDAIGASLLLFFNAIAGLFGTNLAQIGAIWSENWNLLGSIFSGLGGIIGGKIQEFINNIKTMFAIDWGAVGQNIITGIANGITGGLSILADAARRAAQSALDAAKSALGIHSPSTEAEKQVGGPLAEGIGVGVRNQEGALRQSLTDMLNNAMQGLGMNAVPLNLQPVPALNLPAGGTTVNVYNNAPLQIYDEYTLENQIAPVIDRINRKRS
jgi:hypothetical protein